MDGETTCTRRGLLRTGGGLAATATAAAAAGTAAAGGPQQPDPGASAGAEPPAAVTAGGAVAQTDGEQPGNATDSATDNEAMETASGRPAANRTALQTMLAMLVLGFLSPLLLLLILRVRGGE